jgi:predicted nucleotidyltransferase
VTLLRSLGPDFDPVVVGEIDSALSGIVEAEKVAILLAVESGSRAWGFASPDSDYDCRFIYARRSTDYLQLYPPRDVIEIPPGAVLDINGWDILKALRLLLKGNAVVIEWLTSPYVYRGVAAFRDEALALARQAVRPGAVARHYLHLGERQRRTYFSDQRAVPVKKTFYALRPAVALRWLRLHPGRAVAPMHFPTLVSESDLPINMVAIIDDLLARKSMTRELGTEPLSTEVGALIDAEFAIATDLWSRAYESPDPTIAADANELLRRWVEK